MTGSSRSLSTLQRELLSAFFEREDAFSLTGGAALVEFYLHHRDTKDLDFFAGPGADMERAELALADAILSLNALIFGTGMDVATVLQGVCGAELERFRADLEAKLRRMAHPPG